MNVKWVNSSSVLSWMYCDMSESSTASALVYALLPVPPGTSLSWTPPSSLYCCQKSVSKISAADKKRRIASSPPDSRCLRRAEATGTSANRPAPSAPAPADAMNERRLLRNRPLTAASPVPGASPTARNPPPAVDRKPPDCVRQQPTRSCSTPRHERPRQLPTTSFAGTPAPDKPHGPDDPAVTSPDALTRAYLPAETRRSS